MYDRILIVVDDASTSAHALDEGLALAQTHGSAVVLLGVMPASGPPVSDLPVMGVVGYADLEPHGRRCSAAWRTPPAPRSAPACGVAPWWATGPIRCTASPGRQKTCIAT